jgi:hypothetical protein
MKLKEVSNKNKGKGYRTFSLVKKPAIQINHICLSAQIPDIDISLKMSDKEKHQIVSPLLIPGKKIYRTAESMNDTEDGFVFWNAASIRKEQQRMMGENINQPIKLDHESETEDAFILECWIKEDNLKDNRDQLYYEKGIIPVGTLMLKVQITNNDLWNKIKEGDYQGISVEGDYDLIEKQQNIAASEEVDAKDIEKISKIIAETIIEIINRR